MFTPVEDLKIGQVVEVAGTHVKVQVSDKISELSRTYNGRVYPVGQIGSMVKIHYGRKVIFGLVTLLRMRTEELLESGQAISTDSDQRVMEIQLLAEGSWNSSKSKLSFKRGIKTYPLPQQGVFLLTNEETTCVYESAEGKSDEKINPLVAFATYSAAESTFCRANINTMFGMHCAVLGSTGSGKSGTVAAIIHSVLEHKPEKFTDKTLAPQIIVIDPHGEYGAAFKKRAIQYRAYNLATNLETQIDELQKEIKLPYWLMSSDEFINLVVGKTERSATSQNNTVQKALAHARMVAAGILKPCPNDFGADLSHLTNFDDPDFCNGKDPADAQEFDIDKPRPFCLNEFENHIRYIQGGRWNKDKHESLTASALASSSVPAVLDKLKVLRRDKRLLFLMENYSADNHLQLADIFNQLVGQPAEENKDIKIIDISGLPNEVAGPLTALISRLLFQYKVFQIQTEKEQDPILLVCEEAHRYVPDKGEAQYSAAQDAIRRIAREGRKYGIGLMLVSQRPSDVDSTVISQCGTWVVLRLTNSSDQQHVARFLPDGLSGMVNVLPVLSQQEAIFVGEGAALPSRIRIRDLKPHQLPDSTTIPFAAGWAKERLTIEQLKKIAQRMSE